MAIAVLATVAVAGADLVAWIGSWFCMSKPLDNYGVPARDESEIVASDENLEIATDFDFYRWLDEQPAAQAET